MVAVADWTKPFDATYEWWRVPRSSYRPPVPELGAGDPGFFDIGAETERVTNITDGKITVNDNTETFETATVNCVGPLDVGTDLLRCHMVATFEDGTTEDVVLGTFVSNVPKRDVQGSYEQCAARLDGRLMELAEDSFEDVYTVPKGDNGFGYYSPVVRESGLTFANTYVGLNDVPIQPMNATLTFGLDADGDNAGGSKLDFLNTLTRLWDYRAAKTDQYGRIRMQLPINYEAEPVWRFAEGINATFLADVTDERDTTDVCNVVLAIYESPDATVIGTAVDDDPLHEHSTVSMGRRKVAKYKYQDTVTQEQADATAQRLLVTQQSVAHRVTVQHVWCGARVGDIVELDYPSAGISGKFAIRAQSIDVGSAGCLTTSELRRFERA